MILDARRIVPLAAAVLLAVSGSAEDGSAGAPAAFERLKSLAGEWVAAEDSDFVKKGDLVSRYVVTAGGSAVVETVFPGSPHEMVTVYHTDGPDVVLTHYCMDRNQPRMRARDPKGGRLSFAYDGGTNIDPARDRHMHTAWMEFPGKDELRTQWTEHADGQVILVVKSHLVRKAR